MDERKIVSHSLNICFFWHMHQPDYRGSNGIITMPWVFLHAIKDYYEMPWLLSLHKDVKATFNITAPLIEQLNLYSDPVKNDYFFSLWAQHPSELEGEAKTWLIKTCKSTQYETMIKPIPSFDALYHKETLNDQELIDMQVLFLLAWCGNYLRKHHDLVKALFKKGSHFTQADKSALLSALSDFTATILPFYAKLHKKGIISLATTPYNHPILPLLLDMQNVKKANSHTPLPEHPLSLKTDAIDQVERAITLFETTFGMKPTGFWPAEGAVDEESIEIYKNHGLKWIATDEEILFRSLQNRDRARLYQPYRFNEVTIGFRDHGLSDLIGFTYRFKSGDAASEHFINALEPIAKADDNPTVFVILDGENAWEFFENNAFDFFSSLYQKLSSSSWCHTITMDEVNAQPHIQTLDHLASGSWINGEFNTWAGHSEKNRAWQMIYQTRRDVDHFKGEITPEMAEEIKFHFLASECSDWFWWYGDDHVTEFSYEFDALFREHLIAIYRTLKMQPPVDLFEPIITQKSTASFMFKPQASISPAVDGKNSSFFEWLGSGSIDESKLFSTMDRVRGPIEKIYYGHDENALYLAFEGDVTSLDAKKLKLQVMIEETDEELVFDIDTNFGDSLTQFAVGERVELALDRAHFKEFSQVHLRFEILKESQIIQTMPGFGALSVDLDETYEENWFV